MNNATSTRVVTAARVLVGYDASGEARFKSDVAIVLDGATIRDVVPAAAIVDQSTVVASYPDHILVPGFVNAHHHVGITPIQRGSLDLHLEEWIAYGAAQRGLDPYLDTLFSAIEMVRSGITTVQHIQGGVFRPAEQTHHLAQEILRAYRDVGMRASFCLNARDQSHMSHDSDADFLARAPETLKPELAAFLRQGNIDVSDHLTIFDELTTHVASEDRLVVQLAPANLHWCSDKLLETWRDKAAATGVPMHMHLVETPYQAEYAFRRTGKSAVAHLADLGLLGPAMTIGHGVWLSPGDLDLLAESGTCLCHNCSSNLRLGSGRAPLTDYLDRGIPVALGIDEAGVNDDRDMLLEMRMALYQHRMPGLGARWPHASEVMRAATEGGAGTTAFGASIGRIAPGALADFSAIDWKRATWPYQDDNVPVINALVQRVKPEAIAAVWVAGERIVDQGRLERIDVEAIHREIAERLAAQRSPGEQAGLRIANGALPLVREAFADYDIGRFTG